jgi:hypothetical protein
MNAAIRWLVGLSLAPLLCYLFLTLFLLFRMRPGPIVIPWTRSPRPGVYRRHFQQIPGPSEA